MPEDNFHTLVGCKLIKKVWRLSIFAHFVPTSQSINFFGGNLVQSLATSMSKETFESFVVLAWKLWRNINLFLYNDEENDTLCTLARAEFVIKNYKLSQQSLVAVASTNSNDQVERWAAPPGNLYKLNIDASIKFFEGIGSLGGYCQKNKRRSYGSSSIYKAFFWGCGVCEAEAVFQGHKLACDSGLFSFIVELDSLHDLIDLPLWSNMYQDLVTWWLTC